MYVRIARKSARYVAKRTANDRKLRNAISDLFRVARKLKRAERDFPELFSTGVNDQQRRSWRDFEARYAAEVAHAAIGSLFSSSELHNPTEFITLNSSISAEMLEMTFEIASDLSEHDSFADIRYSDGYTMTIEQIVEQGRSVWSELKHLCGIEPDEILRRRALVPHILVPAFVDTQNRNPNKLSAFENLHEAQRAFIFGLPLAAIAMLRSTMEGVLINSYGSRGRKDLEKRIDEVAGNRRLPPNVSREQLHAIRELGNTVLHLLEFDQNVTPLAEARLSNQIESGSYDLEKKILNDFEVIRELIEGAP